MQHSRRRGALAVLTIGLAGLAIAASAVQAPSVLAAAKNTLRITPATTSVPAAGGTFNVSVIVNASVATSGVQASITFDKSKVQVTSVAKGTAYAAAALFLGGGPSDITKANSKGDLKTVAAAFLPPGTVGTGDQDFLDIGFKAIACGKVTLGLPVSASDASLLDGRDATYGKTIKPTTTGATVQICAPGASATPAGSTSAATPTPTPTGSVLAASSAPSAAPVDSTAPSTGPTTSELPSVAPSASTGPVAIVASPSPAGSSTPTSSTDSGGPPWLLIGLVVVVVAAAGGTLLVRSRRM